MAIQIRKYVVSNKFVARVGPGTKSSQKNNKVQNIIIYVVFNIEDRQSNVYESTTCGYMNRNGFGRAKTKRQ